MHARRRALPQVSLHARLEPSVPNACVYFGMCCTHARLPRAHALACVNQFILETPASLEAGMLVYLEVWRISYHAYSLFGNWCLLAQYERHTANSCVVCMMHDARLTDWVVLLGTGFVQSGHGPNPRSQEKRVPSDCHAS